MKHIYQDKGQTNSNHRKKIFQQKWNKRVQKELRIVGILSYWFLDIRRQAGSIKNSLNFCLTTWRNISFIYIMCVPFLFFVCALYFSSHHSRFFPRKWIRKIQANPARASDLATQNKTKNCSWLYSKSYIGQVFSVNTAGYWPRSFFALLLTSNSFWSMKNGKKKKEGKKKKKLVNNNPSWPHAWPCGKGKFHDCKILWLIYSLHLVIVPSFLLHEQGFRKQLRSAFVHFLTTAPFSEQ